MPHERSGGSLTFERLRWLLGYDRATGIFVWKNRDDRTDLIGKVAGCISSVYGYRLIRVDGFLYKASRLAWLYCTGEWPSHFIDHIDGRRDNDAFANLREATSQQNNSNKRPMGSLSGFKGVYLYRGKKYQARLMKDRRCVHLGYYDTPLEAAAAYNRGALQHFGTFARLNQV